MLNGVSTSVPNDVHVMCFHRSCTVLRFAIGCHWSVVFATLLVVLVCTVAVAEGVVTVKEELR